MIKISEQLELNIPYDLKKIGPLNTLLFFDIETTGLSAHNSSLYLIGCIYFEEDKPHFIQWLAESLSDELTLLENFFDFAKNFDTLISFNGATFDTNYLEICANQYGVSSPLSGMNSYDILKEVRHIKNYLQLENCKQKSIEIFLGIHREDQFSGGELIPVYEEYVEKKDLRLQHFLLLHNREDLIGMTQILPILNYVDFFKKPEFEISDAFFRKAGNYLDVQGETRESFPVEIQGETENHIWFRIENNQITFAIPSYIGEMKYYYPNFKDYYYLPSEDTAIHKKIAQFVDKTHRVQATKDTCYQKMSGQFLIAPKNPSGPTFKASLKDSCSYIQYEQENLLSYLQSSF